MTNPLNSQCKHGTKKEFCSICRPKLRTEIYCPICRRVIVADNIKEIKSGEHDGYIFVHDEVPHADEDIETLSRGMQ